MRILIADDEAVSRRLLEVTLRKRGYEVQLASDGAAALDALLAKEGPRLAILDWMMPGLDGVEVCRRLRARWEAAYVYVVLLTARDSKTDVVRGLESGADDFLTKPFHPAELEARLRAGRRILDLQTSLLAAQEALRLQATHDELTGLLNRGAIMALLDREVVRAARERAPCSVLLLDLDHFKRVNDTWGHAAGDAVLREAASRLRLAVRPYDAVGRYGGEEMVVILPHCSADVALDVGERVRAAVASSPVAHGDVRIPVTVSGGVCAWAPGLTPGAVVAEADAALYRAKRAGRNRIERA